MNLPSAFLWGFVATIALTSIMSASLGLGLTRMDIPLMLGTMFTNDRARAKWVGFLVNFVNGWAFAFLYIGLLNEVGMVRWWAAMGVGLAQSAFVLLVALPILPTIHPRMASEDRGPDPTRQLEPPGFLALHYGRGTPIATIVAHLCYGLVLGLGYRF